MTTEIDPLHVALSKILYPGATKHPATDTSVMLTDVADMKESRAEQDKRAERARRLVDNALSHMRKENECTYCRITLDEAVKALSEST